ncbi:HNH endonuclease signature motif containing protein [Paractinoplanes bogorensis]|uniref:HNH endonuclease signature motif containing protein n=1 Tax=Paractinoplanes bogorensis TaxID=1610840 RepID=UPI0027E1DDF7|nr:DUF222 domain-containing protein [Actinoplanes bogorensis]
MTQLGQDAAKLAAASLWPLGDDDLTACLDAAYRLEQTAFALQTRLVQHAERRGLPTAHGHRSTATWLRARLRLDLGPARRLAERAADLTRQPAVEQALLDGHIDARQATAIATALDSVTTGLIELDETTDRADAVDADTIVEQAGTTLIAMAGRLTANQLSHVGDRILTYVAPHLADRADELALARQEARAHRNRGLTLSAPDAGIVRLTGLLGQEDAAILQAALLPLCGPTPDDNRRPAQRRADALIDICRLALRTGELPESGGEPAQLSVTLAYDPLTRALGTATTDTGLRLSAATARRLACDARILPAVLGSAGQVLDLGRSSRLASTVLRRALTLRDRGCAFPDCDRPPRWTDAHHITPWSSDGSTALDNLVLLCRHHHRLAHDPTSGWKIRLGTDRQPDFIPPRHIDPARQPRRNLYHPRA